VETAVTIAATLSPAAAAAERSWQAVVVGAGPAGSIAARELARRGVRTLLLDKANFPRGKVCGCCLNGSALATLDAVGLGALPSRLGGVPLNDVRLSAGGRTATIRLPNGMALSREAFDAALVGEAIAAGVEFLPNASAKRADPPSGVRDEFTLRVRCGGAERSVTTGMLVDASGLNGGLDATPSAATPAAATSRIGAGVVVEDRNGRHRPGTIYMAVGSGGYVGAVRLEDGRLDVAAAFDAECVRREGLGRAACAVVKESGAPVIEGLDEAPWRGTPALTRSAKHIAGRRWFAVGDAAGYVEPFTGEGMAWAMASGVAVAPHAASGAKRWNESLIGEWERDHVRLIRSRQGTCRLSASVLRSPMMSRFAVGVLSMIPCLSRPVVAALNRASPLRRATVA
jgi:flavin-dependent dehydrogenase